MQAVEDSAECHSCRQHASSPAYIKPKLCQVFHAVTELFLVLLQIRLQDSVQAAAAAAERQIKAENYRATLVANMQLAQVRAAWDEADRQAESARSEAELASTIADPYLAEDPAMASSSLSAYRWALIFGSSLPVCASLCAQSL